jgi:hypothetical protein
MASSTRRRPRRQRRVMSVEGLESRVLLSFGPASEAALVNQTTSDQQREADVASDANGNFVVAWGSYTGGHDAFLRRFSAAGQPLGDEIKLLAGPDGFEFSPSVAMAPDGRFVVAWEGNGLRAQRYSAAGEAQGAVLLVNQTGGAGVGNPSVGIDRDGDFVVAWSRGYGDPNKGDVLARRYAADGAPLGDEFAVAQSMTAKETLPAVAMDADGDFIVGWQSNVENTGSFHYDIYARRYNPAGEAMTAEMLVNAGGLTTFEENVDVAMTAGGASLITWSSGHKEPAGGETGDGGVYGRFYAPGGAPLGPEFRINQATAGKQLDPSVGTDGRGNFLVTWTSLLFSPRLVFGRTYTSAGPTSGEMHIAGGDTTEQYAEMSAVALDPAGGAAIAWRGPDLDNGGIWARRFSSNPPTVTGVFVDSQSWGQPFRQYLGNHNLGDVKYGFAIDGGADQLKLLPWVGLNRISIRFSGEVDADFQDLVVRGTRAGDYPLASISFDHATHTVTWTLAQPLDADRVTLQLDADAPDGVKRTGPGTPDRLDGDWADGADAFPSGDGSPGGDFVFRLNVLPGDVDRSGTVLANDFSQVKQKFFSSTTNPGTGPAAYTIFHDVDGSGSILADDFSAVKARFFNTLPAGQPTAAATAFMDASPIRPSPRQRLIDGLLQ